MNTLIEYMYRDASNYKKFETVIVKGKLKYLDLEPYLHEGEFFIPSTIGLKDLQDLPYTEDDHIWHTISEIYYTSLPPTNKMTSIEFIKKFKNAYQNNGMNLRFMIG